MSRADRRRAGRAVPRNERAARPTAAASPPKLNLSAYVGDNTQLLARAAFLLLAGVLLFTLWRALENRITWYLAVDQFGYLQFANDLLRGKVFHDWEPARLLGILPKRTDVLAQTYVWDNGVMYCRYSPGFPILVAGWLALFGEARIAFLNPTLFLVFMGVVIACTWRLTGSVWRGLVAVVLIALTPTQMYWWSLTLTRDLSAHLFGFIGLYQLIPRAGQPLTLRRAAVAGLAIGFAGSIRNDAVMYLLPASLLAGLCWFRERPASRHLTKLVAGAAAALLLGLLPTLTYNTMTSGNPLRPTQGMEIDNFMGNEEAPTFGVPRAAYPSLWKGGTTSQVQGGGLRLENFPKTAPLEWNMIFQGYGWVLIGLAGLGALVALVHNPTLFLFAVPYVVTAFLFYSCWARPDRRYIIGLFSMTPFLITNGVFGTLDLLGRITKERGEPVGRAIAGVVAIVALVFVIAPIELPPPLRGDMEYLSKGTLAVLTTILPLALGLGAFAVAAAPSQPVTQVLAPALAVVLAGYGISRADATSAPSLRAPFQRPQVVLARETMRQTLEPRSFVITSEDMGRPAENIEQWGGFPALYLTDLDRWKISPSQAALSFISAGVRPYLLVAKGTVVPQRGRALADLAAKGFRADLVLEIPAGRNMQYFVATPGGSRVASELFRISHPEWEKLLQETGAKP